MSPRAAAVVLAGHSGPANAACSPVDVVPAALKGTRLIREALLRTAERYVQRLAVPAIVPPDDVVATSPDGSAALCPLLSSDDVLRTGPLRLGETETRQAVLSKRVQEEPVIAASVRPARWAGSMRFCLLSGQESIGQRSTFLVMTVLKPR